MFLAKEKRKHGTNLCIMQSYRDPETKVSKTKRIMNLGYLEDLQKLYDDPIAHFQQVAKEMSEASQSENNQVHITLDPTQSLEKDVELLKNYGYAALSALYHELKLDVFFRGRQRSLGIDYNLNSIMKLLVYGGILYPGPIKHIYENRKQFFDKMDFSLADVYSSFTFFHRFKAQLQAWIQERICENYGRDTSQIYYYLTKHYFETTEQDSSLRSDCPKEQRLDPIIQMGLFVDQKRLPISFELIPRTFSDTLLLSPELLRRAKGFGAQKVILVGDNGINSADDLYYLRAGGNGYLVCQSIRGADQEIKDYVTDQAGFTAYGDGCKVKSRIHTRKIRITASDGSKKTVSFDERQIVFYYEGYARCVMAEREDVLLKAKDLIASPGRYHKTDAYGAAKYIQNIKYDRKTGAVLQGKQPLHLDKEELKEEERYDGYYLFISSELDENIDKLIDLYNDLWLVEDTFKYKNSAYRARPGSVSRVEYMNSHFLSSFISLVLTRILEMKIQRKFHLNELLQSLRKCNCVHIEGNHYALTYFDSVLDLVGKSVSVDFSTRYGTLQKIKKRIGSTKKNQRGATSAGL